jgi:Domain of unknown function (DUF4279)
MKMAKSWETSSTKSDSPGTIATFATFRLSGDRLDPDAVSAILSASPTIAYRKGARYCAGPRSGYLVGRTGVWYLSTKGVVSGLDPIQHLRHLTGMLDGLSVDQSKLSALQGLMHRDGLQADASLFWHGSAGASMPTVPSSIERVFEAIPARLERDFDCD